MLSFRNRLLVLLIGLVVGAQIVTLFTALARTSSEERTRADTQLVAGAQIARQVLAYRERQLANAVTVLVSDYGLREAVGTGDAPTLASALDNLAGRIGAQLTVALDLNGNVIAHGRGVSIVDDELIAALHRLPSGAAQHAEFIVANTAIYQVFAAPVLAPDEVGRVVLGFAVDNGLAAELRDLVGVEVAFLSRTGKSFELRAATPKLLDARAPELATALSGTPEVLRMGGDDYLATAEHLASGDQSLDIALLKPMEEVLAPFRKLAWNLGYIFGFTLLAAVVAGIYLGGSAARPVQRLAAVAERVAAGDYSQRADSGGGSELANLARAFNSMQSGIAERETRLTHLALHDVATGLPNRAHLEQWLNARLTGAHPQAVAVVQLVITNVQEISATLGFGIAERLIQHITTGLTEAMSEGALVARLGGAEFAVVAPSDDVESATRLAARIRERCVQPLRTEGVMLQATLAQGVALCPRDARAADEALRCANAALESALTANQLLGFFAHTTDESQRRRLALGADLPNALRDGQMYLLYQPKMRVRDQRIGGVESLVRWQHPVFGNVSPAEFVPIAERTGASAQLTRWVLRTAVEQLSLWHQDGLRIHTAVNLSASDLLDERLLQDILGALRDFNLPSGALTLEITESVLLREPHTVKRNIELLRVAGVRFSVDDFGTGYSSLSQLRELAVDELKIDQAFVRVAARGQEDIAVLKAIVEMAHGLGLRTVAEGVESEAQRELLTELGCDYLQGYLISRPSRAADLEPMLRASGATGEKTTGLKILKLRRGEA
jgi:diguanylate cyclase (GGDEF)-like protein